MSQFALSALVGASSGSAFHVLLQASSLSLAAGLDAPRTLTAEPLAPLDGTALSDAAVASLLAGGVLPAGAGGGAPVGAGATVAVVAGGSEPIALGADLWAFHARAPAPLTALSRGVPTAAGAGWHLPLDFSGRPGAVNPPTGVALSVVSVEWVLRGAPTAQLYGVGGALAGAPAGAHTVTLDATTSLAATVPAGALRPGYVYRPTATFTLRTTWSTATGVTPWGVAGAAGAVPAAIPGTTFDVGAVVTLASVTSAYAPLLYVHAPPVGGAVSVSPPSGAAFTTQFTVGSAGWGNADAVALGAAPPLPSAPAAAVALALTAGQGLPGSAAAPCVGAAGTLQALLAARLSSTATMASFCAAGWAGRASAASVLAAGAPLESTQPTLIYTYAATDASDIVESAQLGSGWPLGLSAVPGGGVLNGAGYAALWRSQAALAAGTAALPGSVLGARGRTAPALPAQPLAPLSAGAIVTTDTPLLLWATARDRYGGVGVAFGFATLKHVAAPPPSAGADSAAAFVASTLTGSAGGSAATAVSQAAAAATILTSASSASGAPASAAVTTVSTTVLNNLAGALPALASADPATATAAAANALGALTAIANSASASASSGGAPATPAEASAATSLAAAAVSGVSSLLTLYNASGALSNVRPPVGQVLGVLGSAVSVAASTTTGGTGAGVNADTGLPIGGNTLSLSTGGVAPSLKANVTAAIGAAVSALLEDSPLGMAVPVTSAPTYATDRTPPVASYCGPAFSLAAARVGVGAAALAGGLTMNINPPLNPCFPAAATAGAVTLPPNVVAEQPAPSTSLTPSLLAALSAAAGGRSFDVNMVQWGVSPNSETAVLSTRYPSLPAASDVALSVAAAAPPLGGRRGLANIFAGIESLVNSLRGKSAGQASATALTDDYPRAVTDDDLLPHRPMDSRTVSLSVTPAGSLRPLTGLTLPSNFTLVIPLRDLSIVNYAGGQAAINVGQGAYAAPTINVTCPASLAAARAGVVAFAVTATGARGARVPVTFVKAKEVDFTGVVGTEVETAGDINSGSAALADGGISASTDTLSNGINPPPTVDSKEYSYILSVECGKAFGARTFVCGPGAGGTVLQYSCPVPTPVATCFWFDDSKGKWSMVGTSVVAQNLTSVTCSTVHVADHAVRFATLPQVMEDVFATQAPLTAVSRFGFSAAFYATAVTLVAFFAVAAFTYGRRAASERWAAALAAHPEVAWLAGACAAEGLDFNLTADARGARSHAKVAPAGEGGGEEGFGGATAAPSRVAARKAPARAAPLSSAKVVPVTTAPSSTPLHSALAEAVAAYLAPYRAVSRFSPAAPEGAVGFGARGSGAAAPAPAAQPPPSLDALLAEYEAPHAAPPALDPKTARLLASESPGLLLRALVAPRMRAAPLAFFAAAWPFCCVPCGRRAPLYYHPRLPAALPALTRLVFSACASVFGLAGVCLFYSALVGGRAPAGKQQLAPLGAGQLVLLAAAAAMLVSAPLDAALGAALRWLASRHAAWSAPALARERARRAAAAALLAPLPSSALLALLGRPLPSPEAAEELDGAAPPGWVPAPQWLLSLAPGLLTALGRHPEQLAAAAAAADAAGAVVDAEALRTAFGELRGNVHGARRPGPCGDPTNLATFAAAVAFALAFSYVDTWMRTRGVAAGSLACGAWVLAWVFNLALVAPLAAAASLYFAPAVAEATAWLPSAAGAAELERWDAADEWAAAAASAAAAAAPEADGVVALVHPRILVAAIAHATQSGTPEARTRRLRAALLVRAYHYLLERSLPEEALEKHLPPPLGLPPPPPPRPPPPPPRPPPGLPPPPPSPNPRNYYYGAAESGTAPFPNPEPPLSSPRSGGEDALSAHVFAARAAPAARSPLRVPNLPVLKPPVMASTALSHSRRAGGEWGAGESGAPAPAVVSAYFRSRARVGDDLPAHPLSKAAGVLAHMRSGWDAESKGLGAPPRAPPNALLGAGAAVMASKSQKGLNLQRQEPPP